MLGQFHQSARTLFSPANIGRIKSLQNHGTLALKQQHHSIHHSIQISSNFRQIFIRNTKLFLNKPGSSKLVLLKSIGCAAGLVAGSIFTLTYLPSSLISTAQCESFQTHHPGDLSSDSTPPPTDPSSVPVDWKLFFSFLWPEMPFLVGAVISAFVVALLNIKIPLLLGEVINILASIHSNATPAASMETYLQAIKPSVAKIIAVYVVQGLFTYSYIHLLSNLGENMAANMRKVIFASLLTKKVEFYDRHRYGDLLSRLSGDVQDFKSSFKLCISQGLRSVAQIIGSAGALFWMSPQLTSIMFLVVPIMVGLGATLGSFLRIESREAQKQNSMANNYAEEAVSNIRTVKAFAMETDQLDIYSAEVDKACAQFRTLGRHIGMFQAFSNIGLNSLVLGTLCVGGYYVSVKAMSPGDLMAFLVASQTIQRSLAQLSMLFGQSIRGYAALQRSCEFMTCGYKSDLRTLFLFPDGAHSLQRTLTAEEIASQGVHIRFEHVNFSYPTRSGQAVLHDFCLTLPRGKVVALCGKSGSGKSTVVSLLERFYDPQEGEIYLNGQPLRHYNVNWLRQRVFGLISQEPQLFNVSICENIRYGKSDASELEIHQAAKASYAHDFIQRFPDGYDTVVGERATAVSGGEKQRIAIARALLKDPCILILDEATSALDNQSEKIVQTALDNVMQDRTVLVIAHRLSTIRNADLIVVLDEGKIVEKGTHEELMLLKGHYWNMVEAQQKQKH